MMEAKFLRPDTDHAPAVQQDDADGHSVEHGLRSKLPTFLNVPEGVDAYKLGENAHEE